MQDRHSTEDTATGDIEIQTVSVGERNNNTFQLVLNDKSADALLCIPVRVSSSGDLRNTLGFMRQ